MSKKGRPSVSSLRNWGKTLATQGRTNPIRWPARWTNNVLKTYFDDEYAEGAAVDRDIVALLTGK